jgi:hypothetical protein
MRIAFGVSQQHANPPHPLGLLRARRERPRGRRAAEQQYELAALHSITSSARASSDGGEAERLRGSGVHDQLELAQPARRPAGRRLRQAGRP